MIFITRLILFRSCTKKQSGSLGSKLVSEVRFPKIIGYLALSDDVSYNPAT